MRRLTDTIYYWMYDDIDIYPSILFLYVYLFASVTHNDFKEINIILNRIKKNSSYFYNILNSKWYRTES